MKRNGFTVIELLSVLVVLVVIIGIIASFIGAGSTRIFEAEVIEKFTDIDGNGDRVYRVRTVTATSDVDTWNSYFVHDKIQVGVVYQFKASGGFLREAERLAIQPAKVPMQ